MTRAFVLIGFAFLLAAAATLEVQARRGSRLPTLGRLATAVMRRPVMRAALLAGWLWLGWHLFAR